MAKKKPGPTGPEAEQPGTGNGSGPRKSSKRRRATVPHEELVPGTVLTATLKGQTYSASVVLGDEGTPRRPSSWVTRARPRSSWTVPATRR